MGPRGSVPRDRAAEALGKGEGMASYRYPGDDRWQARLRRQVIGTVIAGILVYILELLRRSELRETVDDILAIFDWTTEKSEAIARSGGIVVILVLGWLLSYRSIAKAIDFHFFPWFDHETLRPIRRQTGLLRWVDVPDSPIHDAAKTLRVWLKTSIHDGRWPVEWLLRFRPGLKEKAFSFALLLGPNGIGKSQLAREMARELAGRGRAAGDDVPQSKERRAGKGRLNIWWRRINPFARRLPEDLWDAGELNIEGNWEERLESWRPAAPTILLLDDPAVAHAGQVVDILRKNSGSFWYSVRLIIVDQLVPPGLDIKEVDSEYRTTAGKVVPVVSLHDIKWSGGQFRAAVAKGLWVIDLKTGEMSLNEARDVASFWDKDQLDRVAAALDGNPLLLAEAAHWLAKKPLDTPSNKPYRSIADLLEVKAPEEMEADMFSGEAKEAYREAIIHRILGERVAELVRSHTEWEKATGVSNHAFIEAMACAAIARGVPFDAFPDANGNKELSDLTLALGVREGDSIPAPASWPVCEVYVRRVVKQFPKLTLDGLIVRAYRANVTGVMRAFGRSGWLAGEIVRVVEAMESRDADASLLPDLFHGAAMRAMWTTRSAVPQALSLLERLPEDKLAGALGRLKELGASLEGRIPDVVVALLLWMKVGARLFAKGIDFESASWTFFEVTWSIWLLRPGYDMRYVPEPLLGGLKQSFRALCMQMIAATRTRGDSREQFTRLRDLYYFSDIRQPLIDEWDEDWGLIERQDWVPVFKVLHRLRALSFREDEIKKNPEAIHAQCSALRASALAATPAGAEPSQRAFVEANTLYRINRIYSAQRQSFPLTEDVSREVGAVAQQFPDDWGVQACYAAALSFQAGMLTEDIQRRDLLIGIADRVHQIAERFPENHELAVTDAYCFQSVLENLAKTAEARPQSDSELARAEKIADRFSTSAKVQNHYIWALGNYFAGLDRTKDARHLRDTLAKAESIAAKFEEFADVQRARVRAWLEAFSPRSKADRYHAELEDVIEKSDHWIAPFADNVHAQTLRVTSRFSFANAMGWEQADPLKTEMAAREAQSIATRFMKEIGIFSTVISTWHWCAYAYANPPGDVARTKMIVEKVEKLIEEHSHVGNADLARLRSGTWLQLGYALERYSKDRDSLFEVLRRISEIADAHPEDKTLTCNIAYCWQYIGFARKQDGAPKEKIEEAISKVQAILDALPEGIGPVENVELRQMRAATLNLVAPPKSAPVEPQLPTSFAARYVIKGL